VKAPSVDLSRIQQDCRLVLAELQKPWKVPAEGLVEAITLQGWKLTLGRLPSGCFCLNDARLRVLTLTDRLAEKLECPHLYREVQHCLLAAELGRIRLGKAALFQSHRSEHLERQTADYALAFLLPQESLRSHPDMQFLLATAGELDSREAWKRMSRVAQDFLVPTRAVRMALELYRLAPREQRVDLTVAVA
jgi:hypothetical protein